MRNSMNGNLQFTPRALSENESVFRRFETWSSTAWIRFEDQENVAAGEEEEGNLSSFIPGK